MTAPTPAPLPAGGYTAKQIAMVVFDLEASVRAWARDLGVGPWTAYTLEPPLLKDTHYKGKPSEFGIRHAIAWTGETQLELVQPLWGRSTWQDHLDEHGEGMHHIGFYVEDIEAVKADVLARGFTHEQGGRGFGADGTGEFAYFRAPGPMGAVLEFVSAPKVRIEPDFVHPAPQEG